jgi:hypothetical protein
VQSIIDRANKLVMEADALSKDEAVKNIAFIVALG